MDHTTTSFAKFASSINGEFRLAFRILILVACCNLVTTMCVEEVTIHAKDAVILSARNDLVGLSVPCILPCSDDPTSLGWPVGRYACAPLDSYERFPSFARVEAQQRYQFLNVSGCVNLGLPQKCPIFEPSAVGPDGNAVILNVTSAGSLSGYLGPGGALLAVFWDETTSNDTARTPPTLNFQTPSSRDYESIAPLLGQLFFLGDGRTTSGLLQEVIAPVGATRLYFGITDGTPLIHCFASYSDNTEDPSFPFRLCVSPIQQTPSSTTEPSSTASPSTTSSLSSTPRSQNFHTITPTHTPSRTATTSFDFIQYLHQHQSELKDISSVQPVVHRFTQSNAEDVTILKIFSSTLFSGRHAVAVGVLTIPPRTFYPGCVLSISQSNSTEVPSHDACRQTTLKQLTASIDIVTNHRCGNVGHLANHVHLQLVGESEVG